MNFTKIADTSFKLIFSRRPGSEREGLIPSSPEKRRLIFRISVRGVSPGVNKTPSRNLFARDDHV